MTTITEAELKPCACGCGELVKGTWKRGHKLRDDLGKLTALPGPDDDLDAGEAEPEPEPGRESTDGTDDLDVPDWVLRGENPPPGPDDGEEEVPADRPPGHLKSPRSGTRGKPGPKTRITATVRKDVHAKIRFVLMPAGHAWTIRDPVCGGTFTQQEPEISAALADIVCDSPDLLNWFTGPAGGFMKYFRLLMAVQPVALTVWAHHVAHAQPVLREGEAQQPPQMPAYAA